MIESDLTTIRNRGNLLTPPGSMKCPFCRELYLPEAMDDLLRSVANYDDGRDDIVEFRERFAQATVLEHQQQAQRLAEQARFAQQRRQQMRRIQEQLDEDRFRRLEEQREQEQLDLLPRSFFDALGVRMDPGAQSRGFLATLLCVFYVVMTWFSTMGTLFRTGIGGMCFGAVVAASFLQIACSMRGTVIRAGRHTLIHTWLTTLLSLLLTAFGRANNATVAVDIFMSLVFFRIFHNQCRSSWIAPVMAFSYGISLLALFPFEQVDQ